MSLGAVQGQLYFKKPPINEVVYGIQFDVDHFDFRIQSEFYDSVKDRYPGIVETPPLNFVFDKNSKVNTSKVAKKFPTARYFFVNAADNKLIQLQEGRFLFNWRKTSNSNEEYPRFISLYKEFQENWDSLGMVFENFAVKPEVNQLELTYMDHIPFADFDISKSGIGDIFKFFQTTKPLSNLDKLNITFGIPAESIKGHLNIVINTAKRIDDGKDIFVLEMTARGITNSLSPTIEKWFDGAHQLILETFTGIVTDKAKQVWEYQV